MLERILENWLDSASERSYQGPLCQMLAADGHRVLHSTRHHPIEFGKDIITVAGDGVPCAFQLKGNPGGRLTLAEFRDIQPQLWQLATQAIVFPGVPNMMHRSYLVTNGYVEEDVQKSLAEMNAQFARGAPPHPRIELIPRGDLLAMATRLGVRLWPSGVESINVLMKLLVYDGRDLFPIDLLHDLLLPSLYLEPAQEKAPSKAEVRRSITSSAILVSTALKEFSRQDNFYAVATAWTIFSSYVIAACTRHGLDYTKEGAPAVDIAKGTIVDSLCALCDEATGREHYVEGDPFTDFAVYQWRQQLVRGLLSLLWFWIRENDDPDSQHRLANIEKFLASTAGETQVWGEAAIPHLLTRIWHYRAKDEALGLTELSRLLAYLLIANLGKAEQTPLASPYYSFEDVLRHTARDFLKPHEDPLERESFKSTTFFAYPLFEILAARGIKDACKAIWPDLTRLNHKQFNVESPWQYCLWRTDAGMEETKQLPLTQEWSAVYAQSLSTVCDEVPAALKAQPLVLMLFVILVPHRATPNVVRFLNREIQRTT